MHLRGQHSTYKSGDTSFTRGGQAVLFDVPGTPLLYKQFKTPPQQAAEVAEMSSRLRDLALLGQKVFVQRSDRTPGSATDSSFCWPVDVIEDAGVPIGVLIPKAGTEFFRGGHKLRTLEFLYLYRTDPANALTRVAVLLSVLKGFALLEDMRLVHGDVAPKNVVWAANGQARMFVLDIDGVRREGAPYWGHVQTPEWDDPRVTSGRVPGHDLYSDWYALGLLVVRTLLCSRFLVGTQGADLDDLDSYLPAPVATAAQSMLEKPDDVDRRPTPRQWIDLLVQYFYPGRTPDLERFVLVDLAVARRRRWERRTGLLGPPYTDLSTALLDLVSPGGAAP